MSWIYESKKPEDTKSLGVNLARLLEKGDLIALIGDLGAGKTLFVQGIAEGLGVEERVTSPTFTLIHQYEGRLPLYHFDVYRLVGPEAMDQTGYEDFFYGNGVSCVEWSDTIVDLLPKDYLEVNITRYHDEMQNEGRKIQLIPHGSRWINISEELNNLVNTSNR